jgi:hypothetical protein
MGVAITVGVLALCVLFIAWQMHKAPEGWEDQNGFHLGSKK